MVFLRETDLDGRGFLETSEQGTKVSGVIKHNLAELKWAHDLRVVEESEVFGLTGLEDLGHSTTEPEISSLSIL